MTSTSGDLLTNLRLEEGEGEELGRKGKGMDGDFQMENRYKVSLEEEMPE